MLFQFIALDKIFFRLYTRTKEINESFTLQGQ